MKAATEEIIGAILGIAVLMDIFLIVLYARANTGLISRLVSHALWRMFDAGHQILAQWATETAQVRESLGFYDMLFYLRFREAYYSVSRTVLTSLDTVALIKRALDDKEYRQLKEWAAVEQPGRAALMELKTLAALSPSDNDFGAPPDEGRRDLWRRRYDAAVERLQRAGIKTDKFSVDLYISLRSQWDQYITLLAPQFAYDLEEIDPALARVKEHPSPS